ncbi:S1 family peptidase [Kitasatospora sp. LaBMicrA B282]|uniref:S1 family peptidase n=1 Tax=Kitasatospora sp. LaBMicrA B282 TaxID=3420949 RepID=UPI003D097A39
MSSHLGARRTGLLTVFAVTVGLLLSPHAQAMTGGTPADPGQDLEDVAFLHPDGSLACEGSIISATAILTSAACVDGEHGVTLAFRYGSHDDSAGGHIGLIGGRVIDPDYNPTTHDSDIAVVHPVLPVVLDANAQPIQLASDGSDPGPGSTVIESGWGNAATQQAARAVAPNLLQQAQFMVIPGAECQSALGKPVNSATMICSSSRNAAECFGDSGAPMFSYGTDGRPVQVGIVSWGPRTCSNAPTVHARVSYSLDFIQKASAG